MTFAIWIKVGDERTTVRLPQGRYTIGGSPASDLVIPGHPNGQIATIEVDPTGAVSATFAGVGAMAGRHRLEPRRAHRLAPGVRLAHGSVEIGLDSEPSKAAPRGLAVPRLELSSTAAAASFLVGLGLVIAVLMWPARTSPVADTLAYLPNAVDGSAGTVKPPGATAPGGSRRPGDTGKSATALVPSGEATPAFTDPESLAAEIERRLALARLAVPPSVEVEAGRVTIRGSVSEADLSLIEQFAASYNAKTAIPVVLDLDGLADLREYIAAISTGTSPMLVGRDRRIYRLGEIMPGGWRLVGLGDQQATVSRDGERRRIALSEIQP